TLERTNVNKPAPFSNFASTVNIAISLLSPLVATEDLDLTKVGESKDFKPPILDRYSITF
ncbi:hypothetical protein, partial [Vibrio parahaemolyticus]|uniref:hypothetical protein n=1 Tax=Vibrio parahaemolyticus TaxID=670 RepID=UPI0021528D05